MARRRMGPRIQTGSEMGRVSWASRGRPCLEAKAADTVLWSERPRDQRAAGAPLRLPGVRCPGAGMGTAARDSPLPLGLRVGGGLEGRRRELWSGAGRRCWGRCLCCRTGS